MKNFTLLIIQILFIQTVLAQESDQKPTFSSIEINGVIWSSDDFEPITYRNGDTIPYIQDSASWSQLTTGAWCYDNPNETENSKRNKLYNYYALTDSRGLIPEDWRLPNQQDIENLDSFFTKDYTSDTSNIRKFFGSKIKSMVCHKNLVLYRNTNGAILGLKCLGLFWAPELCDITYQNSRCEGMDGPWFLDIIPGKKENEWICDDISKERHFYDYSPNEEFFPKRYGFSIRICKDK